MNNPRGAAALLGLGGRRTALLTAACVLALAVGSLLFPRSGADASRADLVVLDPACLPARRAAVYEPLAAYAGSILDRAMAVEIVRGRDELATALGRSPVLVLCPDGVALDLEDEGFVPLVAGRRAAPRNLRPRGVLLSRRDAPRETAPWRTRPRRTVIGDSLSLCGTGAWRGHEPLPAPRRGGRGPVFGIDPYDHGGVLQALIMGCFDYAVVRQWDVERFRDAGLLPPTRWEMEVLTPPAPDLVLMTSGSLPAARRLALGEKLSRLGRGDDEQEPSALRLTLGLGCLNLAGFNLLLEPDLDLVQRNFPVHWPPQAP